MLGRTFKCFWAAHATDADAALLQTPPRDHHRRPVSYAALRSWIQQLRQVLELHADEWLVVAINVAPFSIEETALLLLVAESSNCVYVPVDVQLPLAKQLSLVRSARVQRLVTVPGSPLDKFFTLNTKFDARDVAMHQSKTREKLTSCTVDLTSSLFRLVQVFAFPNGYFRSEGNESLSLCELQKGSSTEDGEAPLNVLFTSGTTGNPKGVLGTRAGAWTRLEWMWKAYPFNKLKSGQSRMDERVLRATKLSFVDSVWEVLGAFLQRVPLVHLQCPRDLSGESECQEYMQSVVLDDSEQFLKVMCSEHVTRFTAIPSVLELLLLQTPPADRQCAFSRLRYILSSGETLQLHVVKQLTSEFPDVTILNLYGSTEVSGDVTCMELKSPLPPEQVIIWEKYGLPIADLGRHGVVGETTSLLLLPDKKAKLQSADMIRTPTIIWPKSNSIDLTASTETIGVLYVSGSLVVCGRIGEDDQKEEFSYLDTLLSYPTASIKGVFKPAAGQHRWFCTGDVCSVVGDFLYFCGRKDHIVKIHGQRVNLEAVERAVIAALQETQKNMGVDDSSAPQNMCGQQVIAFATTKEVSKYALQQHFIVACIVHGGQGDLPVVQYSRTRALNAWITEHYGTSHAPRDVLVVHTNAVHRLAHGKIDRHSLEIQYHWYADQVRVACNTSLTMEGLEYDPKNPLKKLLSQLVADILSIHSASAAPDDIETRTFAELGGDSLLATLFVHELRQAFGSLSLTAQELVRLQQLGMTIADVVLELNSRSEKHVREPSVMELRPTLLEPSSSSVGITLDSGFSGPGGAVKRQKRAKSTQPKADASIKIGSSQLERLSFISRYNQSSLALVGVYLPMCYPTEPARSVLSLPSRLQWELKREWRVNLSKCIDASPLVVQRYDACGIVTATWAIIGSHSAQLVCVDVQNAGQEIWRTTLDDRIEACAVLSVEKGIVYVGTYAGTLFALELETGNTSWLFRAKASIKAAALVLDKHHLVVCGAYDNKLYGLNAITGELRWEIDLQGSIFSTPYYCDWSGQLFAASTSGNIVALKSSSCVDSAFDVVKAQWQLQLPAPVFAGLNVDCASKILVVGCADGQLYGVEMATGEIVWKLLTAKPIFSSPCVYRAGSLVFGSHDGMLRKVCCHNGELAWAIDLHSSLFSSPTVALMSIDLVEDALAEKKVNPEEHLICCVTTTAGQLFFCDEETGSIIYQTGESSGKAVQDSRNSDINEELGPLFGSPVLINNWCLLGTRTNYFYAFKLTSASPQRDKHFLKKGP